jgi:virulence factor Mce-like protein
MRRPRGAIVASPVLIGAVTLLIAIVAIFLAVNANQGLPFVPTYDVKAELPGGNNLVVGNDVNLGGFRVGLVDKIEPAVDDKTSRAIAVASLKLDQKIEPLPKDTKVLVRPRSNLGLKYVELTLGRSRENFKAGDTIPLENARKPIELDEYFSTFNEEMRENQRRTFKGAGDALTSRGMSLNIAIENLVPFMTHLEPVMRTLSDPDTELDEFFKQTGRTSAQIAPVAETYAQLWGNMATTFEALGRDEEALRSTIEKAAPTLDAGIRSFPVQRPFLTHSEELFGKLEPVAVEMKRSLPPTSDAFRTGQPVLRKAPTLYGETEKVFNALDELAENPNTLLALKDLRTTLSVTAPLIEYVAPYQTVCNYWNYYWTALGEHVSEPFRLGTIQRVNIKTDSQTQDNRLSSSEADRPGDVPSYKDPQGATNSANQPLVALHSQSYGAAIDAQGNADCETGQRGYMDGPLVTGGRYQESNAEHPGGGSAEQAGGGSHVVLDPNNPGLAGPTYKGVPNLKDVP